MEHDADVLCTKVPKRRCVSRDAFAYAVLSTLVDPFRSKSFATFANAKAQSIRAAVIVVMAGPARDVPVARQDLVVKKQLTDFGLLGIERDEIVRAERARQNRFSARRFNGKGR